MGELARAPSMGVGGLLPAGPASCSDRSVSGGPSTPGSQVTHVCTPLLAPGPEFFQGRWSNDRLCVWRWRLCSETCLLTCLETRVPSKFHFLTGTVSEVFILKGDLSTEAVAFGRRSPHI